MTWVPHQKKSWSLFLFPIESKERDGSESVPLVMKLWRWALIQILCQRRWWDRVAKESDALQKRRPFQKLGGLAQQMMAWHSSWRGFSFVVKEWRNWNHSLVLTLRDTWLWAMCKYIVGCKEMGCGEHSVEMGMRLCGRWMGLGNRGLEVRRIGDDSLNLDGRS